MLGHTDKAKINDRRPLTENMVATLRYLAEVGSFRDKTVRHQSTKNALRALCDRGYAEWRVETASYTATDAGRAALTSALSKG